MNEWPASIKGGQSHPPARETTVHAPIVGKIEARCMADFKPTGSNGLANLGLETVLSDRVEQTGKD